MGMEHETGYCLYLVNDYGGVIKIDNLEFTEFFISNEKREIPSFSHIDGRMNIKKYLQNRCRNRKRFVKLMMGRLDITRNIAESIANVLMKKKIPFVSYQYLWDFFSLYSPME